MRWKDEQGQAIILVALAMSIFLIGAVGLGFDGSNLYWQRQMAQTAADAAAQSAMMSIFAGTSGTGATAFTPALPTLPTQFTCTAKPNSTPCAYASKDGFGTANDTVTVSFPTSAPGVTLATDVPVNLVKVEVDRVVPTTLMRLLGPTATTVKATATAAIVGISSPIPIVVLHPSNGGAFSTNGGPTVTICGGPGRSIQVNSSSLTAVAPNNNATINLQHAGPLDTGGTCTTGTGADFGVWGGPAPPANPALFSTPFNFDGGTKPGKYRWKQPPVEDPFINVNPPSAATVATFPLQTQAGQPLLAAGVTGLASPPSPASGITCPSSAGSHGCMVLSPGNYNDGNGIALANITALFKPGIYYIQGGGFSCANNCNAQMLSGTADPATTVTPFPGTGTGWDGTAWDATTGTGGGMMVYNTGSGQFSITSNGSVDLIGSGSSPIGSPTGPNYRGILFFEDRAAAANNSLSTPNNFHSLGGGGAMLLQGTIYLTNAANMTGTRYQELHLGGGSGGNTKVQGEIIVDELVMGGNGAITMNLNSLPAYVVDQVALIQ